MSLTPGQKLAHYDVIASIGKGGMGEVYRARDTKLGRDVAIKVLPEEFSQDDARLARFKREAKVLASLNAQHGQGFTDEELHTLAEDVADPREPMS